MHSSVMNLENVNQSKQCTENKCLVWIGLLSYILFNAYHVGWSSIVNNYRLKDVKCLLARIRKELKSIETNTGIRKAMKEILAKARKDHRLGETFFLQVICVKFSSQIMNKVLFKWGFRALSWNNILNNFNKN
jgi:hypothetical protein